MNIIDLKNAAEAKRSAADRRRTAIQSQVKAMLNTASSQGRDHFTAHEDSVVTGLLAERDQITAQLATIDNELKTIRQAEADEEALYARTTTRVTGLPKAYDQVARIGRESRTYSPDTDKTGNGFCIDVARAWKGDPVSQERVYRHQQECMVDNPQQSQRAVGTGAFVGLTVPQYLTDMYAPAIANLRPFADACNHHDLPPDGMTVNISRITTSASAALQASENTAVSQTDMDDTLLTENVQTA